MTLKSRSTVGICHQIPILIQGLARTLEGMRGVRSLPVDWQVLIAGASARPPAVDCLLIDAALVDGDAGRIAKLLDRHLPGCKRIVLVADPARRRVQELMKLRPQAILDEGSTPDDVVSAVGAVLGGETWISPRVAKCLMYAADRATPPPRAKGGGNLTERESQIFKLIAFKRSTNKAIAVELGISHLTVKNHVQNVLKRFAIIGGRHAAADAIRERGLIAG
jgi:DNA-binding NarL/FixJ family response regulator